MNNPAKNLPSIDVFMIHFKFLKTSSSDTNGQLWMITLADLIALLLTFFVLLFAMMKPPSPQMPDNKPIMDSYVESGKNTLGNGTYSGDPLKINTPTQALGLGYIQTILNQHLQEAGQKSSVHYDFKNEDTHLILSLYETMAFETGQANLSPEAIGFISHAAPFLNALPNFIHVTGHADPRPMVSSNYPSNLHLALDRAFQVAHCFQVHGYRKKITGRGHTHEHALINPDFLSADSLSKLRRVDLEIHEYEKP